jgi:hypothetical protein
MYPWIVLRNDIKDMRRENGFLIKMNMMLKLEVFIIIIFLWIGINHKNYKRMMKMMLKEKI